MPGSKPTREQDQVKRKRQNSRGTDRYDNIFCGGFTGDQELPRWEINFLCTLKVNSPFLHQTLLLAISLCLLTFFSDLNSFFRDTHDSEFRVVTLFFLYIIMILYPLLGIYAYVHTHIHVCLVDRQYKIKGIHTDCFGSSKYFHEKHVHENLTKIQQLEHC